MPTRTYVAILSQPSRANYRVDFPDFPDCTSGGLSRDDAMERAVEALTSHIESMRQAGRRLPMPTSVDVILDNPEHEDGEPFSVTVDV